MVQSRRQFVLRVMCATVSVFTAPCPSLETSNGWAGVSQCVVLLPVVPKEMNSTDQRLRPNVSSSKQVPASTDTARGTASLTSRSGEECSIACCIRGTPPHGVPRDACVRAARPLPLDAFPAVLREGLSRFGGTTWWRRPVLSFWMALSGRHSDFRVALRALAMDFRFRGSRNKHRFGTCSVQGDGPQACFCRPQ